MGGSSGGSTEIYVWDNGGSGCVEFGQRVIGVLDSDGVLAVPYCDIDASSTCTGADDMYGVLLLCVVIGVLGNVGSRRWSLRLRRGSPPSSSGSISVDYCWVQWGSVTAYWLRSGDVDCSADERR